jgi:hypothetical protein
VRTTAGRSLRWKGPDLDQPSRRLVGREWLSSDRVSPFQLWGLVACVAPRPPTIVAKQAEPGAAVSNGLNSVLPNWSDLATRSAVGRTISGELSSFADDYARDVGCCASSGLGFGLHWSGCSVDPSPGRRLRATPQVDT